MQAADTALALENPNPLSVGTVKLCHLHEIVVKTDHGLFKARRAFSCLVAPEAGDQVLVAGDQDHGLFVIAVLERQDGAALRIAVQGDLMLGVPNGRFTVAASNGVELASARDMHLQAAELTVQSPKATLLLDQLSCIGSRLFAQMDAIKLVGRFFDGVLERFSRKVKRSYRVVDEVDQVRSGQMDYRADKNMQLSSQNALINARDLVKIDGDQIHLG